MKIGVFGGTFNPPHIGHLNIAEGFQREFNLSKLMVIPTFVPPHKISPDLASAEDRIKMCELTFSSEYYEISDVESQRQGRSYTVDTLTELSKTYEDAEFYFLVGDDMLLSLHTWKDPERILELCKIVSTIRSNSYTVEDLEEYAKEYFPEAYEKGRFKFIYVPPIELSSTEIRERVKAGESIDDMVTEPVKDFIFARGLYCD